MTAQLVRDGNIGDILSRRTAAGATFYGYDGNGNVTLLTNGAGQDVAHYRYDAFGNTLEAVGPRAAENPYRFSTKELHGPSGLYDYGFRFYSPGMGRWLNRDPLQEEGGINLYGMVGNNPINNVDEYGLDWYDGFGNWVNDQLFGKPKNYSSDEDGEVQRAVDANAQVKKTGPKAWKVGAEIVMAAAPVPVPKFVPKARIPIWTKGVPRSVSKNAYEHWVKHGGKFPQLKNALQYVQAANNFVRSPPAGTLFKRRGRDVLLYHPASNIFAIRAPSGAPRTMFKPRRGIAYWRQQ